MNMITNEVNIEDIGRGGIALYQTPDGRSNLEVKLENDTLWLSVAQMSQLFGRDRTVIQRHLNNIFKEGELEREMVCAKFAHTTLGSISPSSMAFLICFAMTVRSFPNSSAICCCESQTVSFSIGTGNVITPSLD